MDYRRESESEEKEKRRVKGGIVRKSSREQVMRSGWKRRYGHKRVKTE
jgi:hypothetical protein